MLDLIQVHLFRTAHNQQKRRPPVWHLKSHYAYYGRLLFKNWRNIFSPITHINCFSLYLSLDESECKIFENVLTGTACLTSVLKDIRFPIWLQVPSTMLFQIEQKRKHVNIITTISDNWQHMNPCMTFNRKLLFWNAFKWIWQQLEGCLHHMTGNDLWKS